MDVIHTVLKFADYNRYPLIGLVLAVSASVWLTGCPATTQSVLAPDRQVDSAELEREIIQAQGQFDLEAVAIQQRIEAYNVGVDAFNETVGAAKDHLQRQYEQRARIADSLGAVAMDAAAGALTPSGAIGAVVSLLGIGGLVGAVAGGIKKDRVIKRLKNGGTPATEAGT